MATEPVDGFTVEHAGDSVTLVLSSRYGEGDAFTLDALDAARIGQALLTHGLLALSESRIGH
jgi:hypothetical protein